MYKRILVPLDGSKLAEQVLPYVRVMAKTFQVPIILLKAFDLIHPPPTDPSHAVYMDRLFNYYRSDAEDYLGHAKSSLSGLGVPIYIAAPEGDAAVRIIAEAEKEPGTLIAMATHGRSGIPRMVMGSVTNRVLHAATDPMLIVRASSEEDFAGQADLKTIIVPVDGSPLAEQVLLHAAHLAQILGLGVTLFRVTPPMEKYQGAMGVSRIDEASGFQFDTYEGLIKEADELALAYLDGLEKELYDLGVVSVTKRVVRGQVDDAIVNLARQMSGNLVVMTTHGRSGIGRWVLGSVADGVVRRSGNPVFVIRPVEKSSAKNKEMHLTDGDKKPVGAGTGSDTR
jgi:nucleotide-binding universal stress UspA family protein